VNPAQAAQIVGYWAKGNVQDAEDAVAASVAFFPKWRATPVDDRARMMERAADLMESRPHGDQLAPHPRSREAWLEPTATPPRRSTSSLLRRRDAPDGKARRHAARARRTLRADVDTRGVGVAVAPWNFPLAILTGLTVAPLVAGNCVIIKPAARPRSSARS